jgi:hypothetical protein
VQGVLFDNRPVIDRDALAALAARAVPREALQAAGYLNLVKSTDLFPHGYSVSHWLRPGVPGSEVLEFNPRAVRGVTTDLPRLTAASYAEQVAVHEAIGARVVAPGRKFLRGG